MPGRADRSTCSDVCRKRKSRKSNNPEPPDSPPAGYSTKDQQLQHLLFSADHDEVSAFLAKLPDDIRLEHLTGRPSKLIANGDHGLSDTSLARVRQMRGFTNSEPLDDWILEADEEGPTMVPETWPPRL